MRSVKYPQRQNFANVVKKKPLLDLQCLQRNHPSVVLLQTRLCSRGRICLGWNLSCFSSFSVAGDINVNMSSCLEPVMSCVPRITW